MKFNIKIVFRPPLILFFLILLIHLASGTFIQTLAKNKKNIIRDKNLLILNNKKYKHNRIPEIENFLKKENQSNEDNLIIKTEDSSETSGINNISQNKVEKKNLSSKNLILVISFFLVIILMFVPKKFKKN